MPLLARHLPDSKADMMLRGLEQEPDGGGAKEQLLRQRAAERNP
ncbi:hypothetical protein C8D87_105265 [Lentzea atacamensis]|uniref:Uncharacterized protein n=1 Tax=Lentzea atacamensis TaxID=531938 RepID=A0ABX9E5X4_9PSEU|nr:hypothetical protein [Lentzea atacamensis]RAS64772.1 hypothetical protein C8D87_105265 [Lentzea atacamensis]